MSLRDWFAGQALIGLLSVLSSPEPGPKIFLAEFAGHAYDLADAMLEERKG